MALIEEVFGEGGLFCEKVPGYRPRPGQMAMAEAIDMAIAGGYNLLAEAGTGIGKSFGYLVPSIAHAVETGSRVIVVTANIALQEQLVGKDLPTLTSVLPFEFKFAIAKGKNNFLCLSAREKNAAEMQLSADPEVRRILEWADSTETGDVSEYPRAMAPATWRRLSVSSDECKGSACKRFAKCFAEKAKAEVQDAQVVVTNYHMFFAHLVVRQKMKEIQERGGEVDLDVVLPPASVIVFDEAHRAADIARDFLGFQVTKAAIDRLARGTKDAMGSAVDQKAAPFFEALAAHRRSPTYRARLRGSLPFVEKGDALAAALTRLSGFYAEAAKASWDRDERAELEGMSRRSETIAAAVRRSLRPDADQDNVFFLEENERGVIALRSKPIEVARFLNEELFGEYPTVVMTSATLSPFSFTRKELGVDGAEEIVAESPFAWGDKVLLVVPATMPPPDDREAYPAAVASHVADACEAARGRTLGLFTSYSNLNRADAELRGRRPPFEVLKQGDAPRTTLAKRFREDESSVLFGTDSFWAGVDVPGESLSCVTIDRLPFPTPDDPIVDAISERDPRWFFTYAVPRAIIQFRQGFGRLIRTTEDRGCVVLLDRRVLTKGYGRGFLASLPKVLMSEKVSDVRRFLDGDSA